MCVVSRYEPTVFFSRYEKSNNINYFSHQRACSIPSPGWLPVQCVHPFPVVPNLASRCNRHSPSHNGLANNQVFPFSSITTFGISKKRTIVDKVVVLHVCLSKSNQVIFVSDTLILQKDYIFVLPTSCQIIFPPWSLWPGWTFKLSHPASLRWRWTFSGNSQIWQTVM